MKSSDKDLFIIIYNPSSEEQSTEFRNMLKRNFSKGAIAKKDVYLISPEENQGIDAIKRVIDKVIKMGESVMIIEAGNRLSARGYPKRFRDWMDDVRHRK
ncbi:MAG: hypothetical protein J6T80_00085 [Paludibacteraceae bacterium]|nr:hypothetical protein [Paludibacteraceae bacterium]